MNTKMTWSDAEIDTILEGWAQGRTMKEIGGTLGTSRSAVSGRLTKLGLFGDDGREAARRMLAKRKGEVPAGDAQGDAIMIAEEATAALPSCCDGTKEDDCHACRPRHGEDLGPVRQITANSEIVAIEINSHEAYVIGRRTRRDAPGNAFTLGEWLPALLRAMSVAIEPDAVDDVHDRNADQPVLVVRGARGAGPLIITRRAFGGDGHVMASAHRYAIDEGLLIVDIEPSAYLLKRQHEDGHLDSAGDQHAIQELERLIG